MAPFYTLLWLFLAANATVLVWQQGFGSESHESTNSFSRFRNNYLLVYSLQMLGDWLQGPYVYALYEFYGYTVGDIGKLFIAGFGSSLVFGTIVGALADKFGRRLAALLYVVTYTLSCFTKHSPNWHVLMVGRLLGGIATSLLFSAFESWLVAEHFKRGFSESLLGDIFSRAVFLGNGLTAIVAGFLGNYLVDSLGLGRVAPFDAAAVFMVIGGGVIMATWTENYGNVHQNNITDQFAKAARAIMQDKKIALLGIMQSLFEASMYTFVFLWTPAINPFANHIPHGMIFACFMTASMVGSAAAGLLMSKTQIRIESYMQVVFGVAAASLFIPFWCHLNPEAVKPAGDGLALQGQLQMIAFCVFEVCVGVFWPSMMKMRASYVPEEMRSTIINYFRIPLNLFVCLVLYNVAKFSLATLFGLCVTFLVITMMCQIRLEVLIQAERKGDASKALLDDDEVMVK